MIILETVLVTVLENWGAFAWASANTLISIRLEPTWVDVSTIWRVLQVSNFTRWKMVMVWSYLSGAKYLNISDGHNEMVGLQQTPIFAWDWNLCRCQYHLETLEVSNSTRWKMVMVWSDLLGAKYLNVFYLAIMRCWCLLMTQEQIQGIGQEGSLRTSTADKMAQQTAADTPRAWAITIPPCQLRILDCYTVTGSNQRCSLEYLPCVHLCNN